MSDYQKRVEKYNQAWREYKAAVDAYKATAAKIAQPFLVVPAMQSPKFDIGDKVFISGPDGTIGEALVRKIMPRDQWAIYNSSPHDYEVAFGDGNTLILSENRLQAASFAPKEKKSLQCECGAAKIGYTDAGTYHSTWCPLFRRD